MVVYIAGPFRAANAWEVEQNIRRAEAVALGVWQAGWVALCPHLNTHHFQGVLPDETWLTGDLELLYRCDVVLTVPGWELSEGARAEVKFAELHGKRAFHTIEGLRYAYAEKPEPGRQERRVLDNGARAYNGGRRGK